MATTFTRIAGMTDAQRSALAEQFENASRIAGAEPVAVVGIGCRFPGGAVGPDGYWRLLENGRDAITEIPADRWDAEEFYDPDPFARGRMPSKWGGFVDDVDRFDAEFFGIAPREAEAMDPQQRVLLEVAWEALEHAGLAPSELNGTRAAVMMGVYYNEYQAGATADPDAIDAYSATGNAHSVTVGRIAYLLGLRGPAVAVDTACSSSLVSVHLACQSLRSRESDLALAGGVNLILRPETQLALAKWGMLSPRGRCHAFDAGADGFVRGEGAGVVVLKRLTDAVRDGDRVLAVVRGSAVNQDGRSNGLTAPNAGAQQDVITRALGAAEVPAASIHYVETHGTGTSLGDPIEFDALAAVYGRGEEPCALGAVKTNIGHLEAAAGIAGFIKTVLSVQKGTIPPNLHFSQWNPAIDPGKTRLFVPTDAAKWPQIAGPRRAAVSSFGLGGTNAHIVVEQGPESTTAETAPDAGPVTHLAVSARTVEQIPARAAALADWLDGDGAAVPLREVARALAHEARRGEVATVCARDHHEAAAGLRALAAGQSAPGVVAVHEGPCGPGVVFVFSGQGSQWAGMGRSLLADEPAFAAAVAELEPDFVEQVGFSLHEVLASGEPVEGIARIQPVLVGVQLALVRLWASYGVTPDAVIGHSMGEVAAAVVAGALTPAQGLKVIATRSRLMAALSGQGAMALLESDAATLAPVLADHPDVSIAVYASPGQTVIAGPPDQVDAVIEVIAAQDRLARRIEVDVASHHRTIDPILPELRSALADLAPGHPSIPVLSTVENHGEVLFDAEYWVANLRNPVRFADAVAQAEAATFVEISPHPLLTYAIGDTLAERHHHTIATLQREAPEALSFHTALATAAPSAGRPADAVPGEVLVDLPPTPWQGSRFWLAQSSAGAAPTGAHPLLGVHVELPGGHGHVWQAEIGTTSLPWLSDHKVYGQPVLPAAGFAEMALAAGGEALGLPVTVAQLEVEEMLPVDDTVAVTTQLTPDGEHGARVEIHSRTGADRWRRHAVARVLAAPAGRPEPAPQPTGSGAPVTPAEFYGAMRRTGAYHGTSFAALTRITRGANGTSDSEIVLPDEATAHRSYRIHPVLLDAALQGLAAAMAPEILDDTAEVTYLPVAIEAIRLYGDIGRRARCHAEVVPLDDGADGRLGHITLTDDTGTPVATITGVYLRRVQRRTVPLPLSQRIFDTAWEPTPAPDGDTAPESGSWLVLTHDAGTAALAEDFDAVFGTPSRRILTADLLDESAVLEAFAQTAADPQRPPAGVVVLAGSSGIDDDITGALARTRELIWAVSATTRAMVGGWHGTAPRLWLVARDGLAVNGGEPGDPMIGALRGMVRVLAYEHPDLHTTLVDVGSDDGAAAALCTELRAPGGDDVIAWRDGRRHVERLRRAALDTTATAPVVRPEGAYLVTGGLGGLGLVVARWLVEQGARRVVLNGRSQPSDEAQEAIADLRERAEIDVVLGDIADDGVATRLVATAEAGGVPLRGVIHGAAVIDDHIVATLDQDSLTRVWAPKAVGAVRLHTATSGRDLDWWVGFSSVAALLGSPGQGAYACANAWLDALMGWRRAAGLPATAINWGQWSDVGAARGLNMGVLDPMSPEEGLDALGSVLAAAPARIGVARLRLDRAVAAFPEITRLGFFTNLVDELESAGDDTDFSLDALRAMEPAQAREALCERLRARVSAIMGYPGAGIDIRQPLTELGMDSLMAVRIRNTVRSDFGVEPPVALLLQGASLDDLTADLAGQLGFVTGGPEHGSLLRDGVQQRTGARQRAAARRKVGQRI